MAPKTGHYWAAENRSLRRIEAATGVRRETASSYLKGAGLTVRPPWPTFRSTGKTGHFVEGVHRLFAGAGGRHEHG